MTVLMIERRIIDAPWLVQWRFLIPPARDKSSGDRHANDERVERTHALFFSMDEATEVACDVGEPVSPDYGPTGNAFNGTVKWVQIDVDGTDKDADHTIGAEERFQLAMARQ